MFQSIQPIVLQPWVVRLGCSLFACLLLIWGSTASAQTRIDSSQVAPDIRPLEPGKPIERELKGGEVHAYQITLAAGQYLHVVVDQRGIDVVVTVLGPDNQKLIEVDSPNGTQGPEPVVVIADTTGIYKLEVRSLEKEVKPGRYEMRIKELREATSKDRTRIAAERAFAEGKQLSSQGTAKFLQNAIKKYEEALSLWRMIEDTLKEVETINEIGFYYMRLSEFRKAIEYFEPALSLLPTVGDSSLMAMILNNIGGAYDNLSEKQKALDYFEQALSILHAIGNTYGEAYALNNIGAIHSYLNQYQKALDYYEKALAIRRSIHDLRGQAETLANIGVLYADQNENQKALDYYEQALPFWRAAGDRYGENHLLNSMGVVCEALGKIQLALDYYNQALPISREVGNRRNEARLLSNIGHIYFSLGESQKAFDFYNQSLFILHDIGDRNGEAITLNNIGAVYSFYGDKQKALTYDEAALELRRTVKDRRGEGQSLNNIGNVYQSFGEYQKALDYYNQALPILLAANDRINEAYVLNNIGTVHFVLKEYQKALDYYDQALKLRRELAHRYGEAQTLNNIGYLYAEIGERQKALNYYDQSLTLRRSLGDRDGEAGVLRNIARVEYDLGNLVAARIHIEATLAIVDSLRSKVFSQELRGSYFAAKRHYYELYIDLLMQQHKLHPSEGHDTVGLHASERARARSLLELLTETRVGIRQGVDSTFLQSERMLQQQLNAKAERLTSLLGGKYSQNDSVVVNKDLEKLLIQYQEVQAQIRATSSRYAALTQPQPLNAKEIQQQGLDDETILLEYSLSEERSFLWAVTPTSLTSFELPKRAIIDSLARRVYDLMTARNQSVKGETKKAYKARVARADAEYLEAAADLSRMILGPAAAQLGTKRLLIVADGALQYIPFGALPLPVISKQSSVNKPLNTEHWSLNTDYRPLVVDHEIISLPSASVLAVLRREIAGRASAPKQVAILADPVFASDDPRLKPQGKNGVAINRSAADTSFASTEFERATRGMSLSRLLFSRFEADAIASLASANEHIKALDFAANHAAATSAELSQYRIIHFATHGLLNEEHPELSGIVFSLVDEKGQPQDGFLRLHEIYNLNLPADLVVLSACQTALGKEIKGEGLVGLTRGFMYAGAPRVVASLWQVNDVATSELMKRFYQGMLGEQKLRPAAALREAQISMWKEKSWQSPYYWAAFVLQGEWK